MTRAAAKESAVEAHFTRRVRLAGGISIKLVPVLAGIPDRLILLPGGRSYLVELKAEDGRLDPIQVVWHQRARNIGHPVATVYGRKGVDAWCDLHLVPTDTDRAVLR